MPVVIYMYDMKSSDISEQEINSHLVDWSRIGVDSSHIWRFPTTDHCHLRLTEEEIQKHLPNIFTLLDAWKNTTTTIFHINDFEGHSTPDLEYFIGDFHGLFSGDTLGTSFSPRGEDVMCLYSSFRSMMLLKNRGRAATLAAMSVCEDFMC